MTSNPTPAIRLHWLRRSPGIGPAFRVLKMGKVTVGRAFPAMTGTGYRAEVYLPGAKIDPGAPGTEAEAEAIVEAAVCAWLESAGIGVGVVVGEAYE